MSKTAGVEVISHFTGPVFHRYFGNYFIYDENCTFQNEKGV